VGYITLFVIRIQTMFANVKMHMVQNKILIVQIFVYLIPLNQYFVSMFMKSVQSLEM